MVAHRCEKPNGFPFGGFVKIQEADMEAILRRCALSLIHISEPTRP